MINDSRSAVMHRLLVAFVLASLVPALGSAQDRREGTNDDFHWTGQLGAGRWLVVKNLNGSIRVEPASGDRAEVVGEKRWRRGDPDDVQFKVVKFGRNDENVLICALWSEDDQCDEEGYGGRGRGRHRHNSGDVSVQFTVKLPAGVKVDVSTVNGDVDVSGARAEVAAHTVNGGVETVTSVGPVNAGTVNGDVDVRIDRLTGDDDLEFNTVNGSVTVTLPADFSGEVNMTTVNGRFRTDFPVTVNGAIDPRRLRATIGKGGRRLSVHTVNGSLELRKLPER
jgi:hypothetical protein